MSWRGWGCSPGCSWERGVEAVGLLWGAGTSRVLGACCLYRALSLLSHCSQRYRELHALWGGEERGYCMDVIIFLSKQ